ncbi:hypothetical protein DWW20_18890 [Ruminococcus sp. AF14-5]|nr:hypothetical protein DWW20_18890 [Ruminococcus sp. AF14-5]
MEAKLGLKDLMVIVIMDIVTLMDIMIMVGMIDMITVIKVTAIISIRIITVKALETTIKIQIAQMIVITGRMRNSSGNITSIIIRKIMQIPETITKTPIEATRIITASHQEEPLM